MRPILYPDEVPENLPSFIKRKRVADIAENKRKAIILNGFEENKVDIDGIIYDYDIRIIDDNNCHIMKFCDGKLLREIAEGCS